MPIRDELWIDSPRINKDSKTGKFLKGNKAAVGRRVTEKERELKREVLRKTREKCVKEGKYGHQRNNVKAVIAIHRVTKQFHHFSACVDCEKYLGMPVHSAGEFCNGKVGILGHRWKDWLLYWENDQQWFDKL